MNPSSGGGRQRTSASSFPFTGSASTSTAPCSPYVPRAPMAMWPLTCAAAAHARAVPAAREAGHFRHVVPPFCARQGPAYGHGRRPLHPNAPRRRSARPTAPPTRVVHSGPLAGSRRSGGRPAPLRLQSPNAARSVSCSDLWWPGPEARRALIQAFHCCLLRQQVACFGYDPAIAYDPARDGLESQWVCRVADDLYAGLCRDGVHFLTRAAWHAKVTAANSGTRPQFVSYI